MSESSTFIRPLRVLEAIAGMAHAPSLAELTEAVREPKPTLFRWLASLEGTGLIQRTPDGRRYELASRASELALSILANKPSSAPRHVILERVVRETGETCNLTVLRRTTVVYLDRVEAAWPLRVTLQPGSSVPIHASASGKLFLALMPRAKREQLFREIELAPYTDNTITDRDRLAAELVEIRKQGFALDREEFFTGLICVAVPILIAGARDRSCVAALAIQAPRARLSYEEAVGKLPQLEAAAAAIAATLDQADVA
jgi:DNA-binding IclR family transcriptional regulator